MRKLRPPRSRLVPLFRILLRHVFGDLLAVDEQAESALAVLGSGCHGNMIPAVGFDRSLCGDKVVIDEESRRQPIGAFGRTNVTPPTGPTAGAGCNDDRSTGKPNSFRSTLNCLEPLHRSRASSKFVRFNSHPLQDADEQIWKWIVVRFVEGQMLTMLEAAAGYEYRQVVRIVVVSIPEV